MSSTTVSPTNSGVPSKISAIFALTAFSPSWRGGSCSGREPSPHSRRQPTCRPESGHSDPASPSNAAGPNLVVRSPAVARLEAEGPLPCLGFRRVMMSCAHISGSSVLGIESGKTEHADTFLSSCATARNRPIEELGYESRFSGAHRQASEAAGGQCRFHLGSVAGTRG